MKYVGCAGSGSLSFRHRFGGEKGAAAAIYRYSTAIYRYIHAPEACKTVPLRVLLVDTMYYNQDNALELELELSIPRLLLPRRAFARSFSL